MCSCRAYSLDARSPRGLDESKADTAVAPTGADWTAVSHGDSAAWATGDSSRHSPTVTPETARAGVGGTAVLGATNFVTAPTTTDSGVDSGHSSSSVRGQGCSARLLLLLLLRRQCVSHEVQHARARRRVGTASIPRRTYVASLRRVPSLPPTKPPSSPLVQRPN